MTTYTLRKGAAERTKADVVVIGVVRTPKGLRAAPGGDGVASAYGRKFAPLLSTIGFTGKPGEVAKVADRRDDQVPAADPRRAR